MIAGKKKVSFTGMLSNKHQAPNETIGRKPPLAGKKMTTKNTKKGPQGTQRVLVGRRSEKKKNYVQKGKKDKEISPGKINKPTSELGPKSEKDVEPARPRKTQRSTGIEMDKMQLSPLEEDFRKKGERSEIGGGKGEKGENWLGGGGNRVGPQPGKKRSSTESES